MCLPFKIRTKTKTNKQKRCRLLCCAQCSRFHFIRQLFFCSQKLSNKYCTPCLCASSMCLTNVQLKCSSCNAIHIIKSTMLFIFLLKLPERISIEMNFINHVKKITKQQQRIQSVYAYIYQLIGLKTALSIVWVFLQ